MRCTVRGTVLGAAVLALVGWAFTLPARAQEYRLKPYLLKMHADDLELMGLLSGLSKRQMVYVSRDELSRLPQVQATIADDPDIPGVLHVRGVRLDVLERALGVPAAADLVSATCTDAYRSYYPDEMIRVHEPILVLAIDGIVPKDWAAKAKQDDPGPYLVLYDHYRPAWKVLAQEDRPQLPTNVVRLTFERQAQAFARIAPGGGSLKVSEGYRIARQNCIRCHAAGETGGTKSAKSWKELAQDARSRPEWFARVIKDPKSVSPGAAMPGNPEYDAATLETLTAYFRSQLQTEGQ